MTAVRKPQIRGACPGALQPMESGDGLIVRVRPHAGAVSLDDLLTLAAMAARYGNGEIDLTRRANLQIRGLTQAHLASVQETLDRIGLLDASPGAEAIRNIVISPLAGLDPTEFADARTIARDLETGLASNARLWNLPPKFGFVIDGGGSTSLDGVRADIRLRAIAPDVFALGIDSSAGVRWIGSVTAPHAAATATKVAELFAASLASGSRASMRGAASKIADQLSAALALDTLPDSPAARAPNHPLGLIDAGPKGAVAALGVPFGRITASDLAALCEAARANGGREMRLSPWRAVYIPVRGQAEASALLARATALHLITTSNDPLTLVDACPGAPACASASVATRSAARVLASRLQELGIASAHVSGCPKGCARSTPAALVLVGGDKEFGVIRNGRAGDRPEAVVAVTLDDLPARLRGLANG